MSVSINVEQRSSRTVDRLVMDEVGELLSATSPRRASPIDVARGVSGFDSTPYLAGLGAEVSDGVGGYGESTGRRSLRERLSRLYGRRLGLDIAPDRFWITDGASGALLLALAALLEHDDEVLVPEVAFPGFAALAILLGARPVPLPLGADFALDVAAVEARVTRRTRAIIVNSPSNPFGTALSAAQLERLADLGVPLISDEVYQCLTHDAPAPSLLHISRDHFVAGSFSKTFAAAGLRLGYLVVPRAHESRVRRAKAFINLATSQPSQILGERLLAAGDAIIDAHRAYLAGCRDVFLKSCQTFGLRPLVTPAAGFFGVLDAAGWGRDTREVAHALAEKVRVGVAPGVDFAARDPGFVRVNFSVRRGDFLEAMARLSVFPSARASAGASGW